MQILKIEVKPRIDRLDQFAALSNKNLSRSKAKRLIEDGFIQVNNHKVENAYRVKKGDVVRIEIPASQEVPLKAEDIPLKIVYEDRDVLVIDKQAGLVVHPTLDHPTGTVVNAVLNHLGKFDEEDLRPGVVHRLDKNTSGLLVIAKNQEALESLKEQFAGREVEKTYLALVQGRVEKEIGSISSKIDRHPKFRSKFTVSETGKEAQTDYKVVERFSSNLTLLRLHPLTGRTHQLRVHLSSIGHAIIGDKLYGGKMLLNRQFLHAEKLVFNHPKTGKRISFETNLPEDLNSFLTKLKEKEDPGQK